MMTPMKTDGHGSSALSMTTFALNDVDVLTQLLTNQYADVDKNLVAKLIHI